MSCNPKTCIERPRKVGAKYTGKGFARDVTITQVDLSYEGKRDRWNGYNPDKYKNVIQDWEALESERQKRRDQAKEDRDAKKQAKKEAKTAEGDDESDDSLSDSSHDSCIDGGEADISQFDTKDPKVRTAVRNLRQREDLPKYLRNLDPNSAHYDGKSRIMKENPNPDLPESDQLFKGDNFVKFSGDSLQVMQQEAFMIKANEALAVQKKATNTRDQPEQAGEEGPLGAGAEINAVAMPS